MGIGIRTTITLYEIPSTALGPELTQDYVERSSLIAFRMWFGWWGGLVMWNLLWLFVVYSSYKGTEDARYNHGYLNAVSRTRLLTHLLCSSIHS